MTELCVYKEQTTFSQLGLNPSDINRRGVIAVGYAPHELLPPYDDSSHQQRASSILTYLRPSTRFMRISGTVFPNNRYLLNFISSKKIIEVIGGLADECVPEAASVIIQEGGYAYVDSSRLLSSPPINSDSILEQVARSGIKELYGGQHLQIGENVTLYYDNNKVKQRFKK